MLNIPEEIKELFSMEGVKKYAKIVFHEETHDAIENENIVYESIKYSESTSSNDFKFGLTELSQIEFEAYNIGDITGEIIEVCIGVKYVEDEDPYYISLGIFIVDNCKISKKLTTVVAYSSSCELDGKRFEIINERLKANSWHTNTGKKLYISDKDMERLLFPNSIPDEEFSETLEWGMPGRAYETTFQYKKDGSYRPAKLTFLTNFHQVDNYKLNEIDWLISYKYTRNSKWIKDLDRLKEFLNSCKDVPYDIFDRINKASYTISTIGYNTEIGIESISDNRTSYADYKNPNVLSTEEVDDITEVMGDYKTGYYSLICRMVHYGSCSNYTAPVIYTPCGITITDTSNGNIIFQSEFDPLADESVKQTPYKDLTVWPRSGEKLLLTLEQTSFKRRIKTYDAEKQDWVNSERDEWRFEFPDYFNTSNKTIINDYLELTFGFGKFARNGQFEIQRIDNKINGLFPSNLYFPSNKTYPRDFIFLIRDEQIKSKEEREIKPIRYGCVRTNKKYYSLYDEYNSDYETYDMSDNELSKIIDSDVLVNEYIDSIKNTVICETNMDIIGTPYLESGDIITFEKESNEFEKTIVLRRRMNGIQTLTDSVENGG